jgi:hypothetical protein
MKISGDRKEQYRDLPDEERRDGDIGVVNR